MGTRKRYIKTSWKCPKCKVGNIMVCNFKVGPDVREEFGRLIITHAYELVCDTEGCTYDHDGWTEREFRNDGL